MNILNSLAKNEKAPEIRGFSEDAQPPTTVRIARLFDSVNSWSEAQAVAIEQPKPPQRLRGRGLNPYFPVGGWASFRLDDPASPILHTNEGAKKFHSL